MSRGYIVIAQNTNSVNYLEQAYALALNLKLTQKTVRNLTVCVDLETKKKLTPKHTTAFDHIVDIPWQDEAANEHSWKIHNKWKYYWMTPYDETVILDTDMMFPSDVSHWWDAMSEQDAWATTQVKNFRGETVSSDYYRKTFTANNLPNIYTAFFYFKKTDLTAELFAMTEIVFQHWQRFFYKYLPAGKPDWLSGDVAFALAMKLLDIQHLCTKENVTTMPTFVHMKSQLQNVKNISENWSSSLPTYYKSHADFKVGNYQQTLPFHYVDKTWMTPAKIKMMEDLF